MLFAFKNITSVLIEFQFSVFQPFLLGPSRICGVNLGVPLSSDKALVRNDIPQDIASSKNIEKKNQGFYCKKSVFSLIAFLPGFHYIKMGFYL